MENEYLLAFCLVYLIDSLSPGPAVAMVVARGAVNGGLRTLPFIAGLVVGELFLFALAVAGLAALAAAMGPLFAVIKWLGVAYLLYLAVKMWRARPAQLQTAHTADTGRRAFFIACLLPLGNPKAVGFYIALLPAVLDVSAITAAAAMQLAVIVTVVWGSVLTGYAALAGRLGQGLSAPFAQRCLQRTSAGTLAVVAGTIALRT